MLFVESECALCQKNPSPIIEDGLSFCCKGCSFVWRVLKGKGVDPSKEDPLFHQAQEMGLLDDRQPEKREGEELRLAFWIEGLFCPSCQHLIEHAIGKMEGVLSVSVDYTTDLCIVWYQPRFVSPDEIFKVVRQLGYLPHPLEKLDRKGWLKGLRWKVAVAFFCTLNVMAASYSLIEEHMDQQWRTFFTYYAFIAALPVPFYAAWSLLKQGFASLIRFSFGVEAFITVAVVSGFVLSVVNLSNGTFQLYLDGVTLLPAFFLTGKLLESRAKGEAREQLLDVSRALPMKARRNDVWVPIKEVEVGDEILILRGEKVVLDGEVTEGSADVDEGIVTGESLPIPKKLGDKLLAGTRLVDGWVKVRVTKTQEGSTLQTMVSLIEEGLGKRVSHFTFLDRFIPYFLPVILVIAVFLYFYRGAVDALSLLLLACPCTLGIALPIARAHLGAELGNRGIVVRRLEGLDLLGNETDLLLDKTGTLTDGDLEWLSGDVPDDEKGKLMTLVSFSNHPLSLSLKRHLGKTEQVKLDNVEELPGKGMQGGGRYLGSRGWFEQLKLPLPEPVPDVELFYYAEGKVYRFLFREHLREGIEAWLQSVKGPKVQILSGDRTERVEKLANRLNIPHFRGEITPEQKREAVIEVQKRGGTALFVGDGVNDGPALAAADLSVSPAGGKDITLFVADLVVCGSFEKMVVARELGIKARKIIVQNLTLSFAYNIAAIFWAIFGTGLTPALSAFVMAASSITVVWNATRIKEA